MVEKTALHVRDGRQVAPLLVSPKSVKVSPEKTRFSRFTNFRIPRPRFQKKQYQIMDEGPLLRRGSADSAITINETQVSSSFLLGILAPLVATLQRVTAKVANHTGQGIKELAKEAEQIGSLLNDILQDLQTQMEIGDDDQHEEEMRSLLLSALGKKVEAETAKLQRVISPLSIQSENPFIVHATAQAFLSNRRQSSTPRKISSAQMVTPTASYSAILGTSQQSAGWAMNLVRVGSFQQSMLFSGSPIAVQRKALKQETMGGFSIES
ncbi:hypothetical protein BCR39DRAFT_577889 [Naematelia encephala]|uniref:Uncharacterized protein n=1 Tax=Naematelia encephala TaxID=71784 RepID=A0A1Y2BH32_9TREE|nr:hypothetical protein BCR39DRAFT_577889 [Naematelia encephala]